MIAITYIVQNIFGQFFDIGGFNSFGKISLWASDMMSKAVLWFPFLPWIFNFQSSCTLSVQFTRTLWKSGQVCALVAINFAILKKQWLHVFKPKTVNDLADQWGAQYTEQNGNTGWSFQGEECFSS